MNLQRKLLLVFLIVFGIFGSVYPQANNLKVDVKSPNVASMDRLDKIPVSYFTGTPNISIPLISLKAKQLSYDLRLDYSANAVKPNNRSGWTGLGWNMNLSYISRQVRGIIDEKEVDLSGSGYYKNGALANPAWNWEVTGTPSHISNNNQRLELQLDLRYIDTEPDIFNLNVMGMHGRFFLDKDRKWKIQSDDFVKIELDPNTELIMPKINVGFSNSQGVSKCFNKFILTDVHGNKYIFGGHDAIEYSATISAGDMSSSLIANSWYLIEIIPANGVERIKFNYERGPYVTNLYLNAFSNDILMGNRNVSSTLSNWKKSGSVISPVYPKNILLNDQEISFEMERSKEQNYQMSDYADLFLGPNTSSNNLDYLVISTYPQIPFYRDSTSNRSEYYKTMIWMKLKGIKHKVGNNLRNYVEFKYRDTADQRLTLDGLVISDIANYKFTYNNVKGMPRYLTTASDHWGFHNGVTVATLGNIYNSRAVDTSKLKLGLLKSISYPTKARTEFVFEAGDFSKIVDIDNRKQLNDETGIGSLRIAEISSYSRDSILLDKRIYAYTKGNTNVSSGILNAKPIYTVNNVNARDFNNDLFTMTSVMSNSVNDLNDQSGVSIGYSEVKEIQKGNNISHTTTYKFSNHDNGYMDDNAVYKYNADHLISKRFNSRAFERGRMLETIWFAENGDTVQVKKNEWDVKYSPDSGSRSMMFNFLQIDPSKSYNYYPSTTSYRDYYYPVLLKATIEKTYQQNTAIKTDRTNYVYSPIYRNLRKSTTYRSNTDSVELVTSFIDEYRTKTGFNLSVLNTMQQKGMFSSPLETIKKVNGKVVVSQLSEYKQKDSLVLPYKWYSTNVGTPLATFNTLNITAGGSLSKDPSYEMESEVTAFDSFGNAIEVKQKEQVVQSLIWGNYGYNPIAKIENVTNTGVKLVLGPNFDFNSYNNRYHPYADYKPNIDSLRKKLTGAQVFGYEYAPYIGVTKIVDPKGSKESFDYDSFGRLLTIFDNNGDIKKSFNYYYANQFLDKPQMVYYNKGDSLKVQRNDCSPNRTGSFVTYLVPAKKYSSTVSQLIVDSLQRADIFANAQAYANQNGLCERVLIPACIKKLLVFQSGQNIETNLYISYTSCEGGNEVTVPVSSLSSILDENGNIKIEFCSSWSSPLTFRYGLGGAIVTIPEILVVNAGTCN